MFKKTITFEDLDGNLVTEDFYFHISKAELVEWEVSEIGGMEAYLKSIIAEADGKKIVAAFKDIISKTVGKRSEDGRRFIKTQAISDEFMQTDAYSVLFLELMQDPANNVARFINGIVPKDLSEKVQAARDAQAPVKVNLPAEPVQVPDFKMPEAPTNKSPLGLPTEHDLLTMSREDLIAAFQKNSQSRSGD